MGFYTPFVHGDIFVSVQLAFLFGCYRLPDIVQRGAYYRVHRLGGQICVSSTFLPQ